MNLLTLENISKSYSEKKLIENISLGINEGEKIGVIGINGTGKSTLLKIIAGVLEPDYGSRIKGNRVRVEYLSQNPEFNKGDTVIQSVFKGNSEEMVLLREYEETLEKLNNSVAKEEKELNEKLISLQVKIDALNAWELEKDAKIILTKLGITNFNENIDILSGGQRKRVALAAALITPCELLILDEPTNHMDIESIAWLEGYLNNRKGALLMITHDRYFLDRVSNKIIEIDRGKLYVYEGNYSVFLEKKEERLQIEEVNEEKKSSLLKRELAWIKKGAKARTTKQKARIQRFEKLNSEEFTEIEDKIEIDLKNSRLGKKIIEVKNISKSFNENKLIDNFNYIFLKEDRIGIIGSNGIGKSTLVKIISGDIKQDQGIVDKGETVKIGVFSQEVNYIDEKIRVIDYIKEEANFIETAKGEKISASLMLEKFLFQPNVQYTPVGKLSGGEKRRLYLLKVLMSNPNFLIFDEPTNDLDIQTLTILEDYLESFKGTVITVSHDRYFIDKVCNKIFYFEGNGQIKVLNGNYESYEEYKEIKDAQIEKKEEKTIDSIEKPIHLKEKKLKFTYKEQKEYEAIETDIADCEEKLSKMDKEIEKYAFDYEKLNKLLKAKEDISKELENKYERWEYLNELAEKIEKGKNS